MKKVPQQTLNVSFQFLSRTLFSLFLKLSRANWSSNVCKRPVNKLREGHLPGEAESAETPRVPGPVGRMRVSAHVFLLKGSRTWLCNTRVLLICTYWIWSHRWSVGTFCESKGNDFSNNMWPDLRSLVKQVNAYSRRLIQTDAWSCPFLSIKSIAFLPNWTKRPILLPFVTS